MCDIPTLLFLDSKIDENMKVTDLMVGDWVEDGYKKSQVTSITCDGIVETTSAISNIDVVDPIPLTEEILVKNGFEKRYFDYDFSYDLYEDDNVSFVRLYDHGEGVFFTETSGGDILIKYVHQLQHLLRLCGIEKEIEL